MVWLLVCVYEMKSHSVDMSHWLELLISFSLSQRKILLKEIKLNSSAPEAYHVCTYLLYLLKLQNVQICLQNGHYKKQQQNNKLRLYSSLSK